MVAANLEAVCNGGDWNIRNLPPGEDYAGPTDHQATECTCSTKANKDRYNPEKTRFDMAASPVPLTPGFTTLLVPPVHQEFKLYDPTDPSTFPTSPAPTLPTYRSSEMPHTFAPPPDDNITSPLLYMGHQGQYTGVPEV
ncbi:hypothetical protein Clacol_010382 [Clathrus columnatus]|uniref:Uncharacterized protein n=1 Tax=Clathrus columnatus TaxID=1419009 RepID=A0AAV5ASW9_9AGAM|nr:hypothetical protein Clacol_010382 [Clathrus columnatus]